jgi:hypothetical protein
MAAQQQVRIPFGKKQELDALRAKVQQDMARPVGDPERITDMQAAQQLQEAATGKSDPLTDLKKIRLGGGGEEGGVPQNLFGKPGVPAAPQFPSPSGNPNLTETEQRENNAKIMTPGYGNQGVNIQMQKNVAPWSGGQSPMVNNPSQPGTRDFRGDETGPFRGPPGAGLPTLQQDSMTQLGMMDRDKAGPMDAVRQSGGGLLQPGMDGLRGMGKAAGGYMKSLFDDPQRMAMLQGGLSMMDPNSYYDKQGFGSVFTGLNKGLGAAQDWTCRRIPRST